VLVTRHPSPVTPGGRAVFLDRDGTMIEEKVYLHRPEDLSLFPSTLPALRLLRDAGFLLFIVTNQSGVGRGFFTMEEVERVHHRLISDLAAGGVVLAKIYTASEAPDQPGYGRKPSPRFLFDAREEFDLDLSRCYMIGDKLIDLECGWNAGARRSLLVRTGYGASVERESPSLLRDAVIVDELRAAAGWVLSDALRPETPALSRK
jgi:D-glycero-D-manno-heptose 1,7-bisphosphate phosphatase